MGVRLDNFFTSGFTFSEKELTLKSRYQMINVALVTSGFAFIYGILINYLNALYSLMFIEMFLVVMNIVLFFTLRKERNLFSLVTTTITVQCTVLMLYIAYTTDIESVKFAWLFTYPIVLLYFQKRNNGIYWFVFLLLMLIIAPFQNIVDVQISTFQSMYISVVLMIVAVIVYFYQIKMNEAADLIFKQQGELQNFNAELALQVEKKTSELQELNDLLEIKVKEKVKELVTKDKLITAQSKQAVMGEMISMIAHQWRQPLSTITLQISNLHFKRILGNETPVEEVDKVLTGISDTIIYLSDTIDDFQTYFRPNKDKEEIAIYELCQKAINFALPRTKNKNIEIVNKKGEDIITHTYPNEIIQVILNLINNSIDAFMEIEKENAEIVIYARENKKSIEIMIQDNAGGISDENVYRVFEPYYSTKGKNGTGLGLYMSQMIIEKQFNGNIKVETSSKGTTFTIEISKEA